VEMIDDILFVLPFWPAVEIEQDLADGGGWCFDRDKDFYAGVC